MVAVLEGVVDVSQRRFSAGSVQSFPPQRLLAGQTIRTGADTFKPVVTTLDMVTPGEWRTGRLAYEDASLSDIVADVNRYTPNPIEISDVALGAQRYTVAFQTANLDGWLHALEQSQSVSVEYLDSGTIVLSNPQH